MTKENIIDQVLELGPVFQNVAGATDFNFSDIGAALEQLMSTVMAFFQGFIPSGQGYEFPEPPKGLDQEELTEKAQARIETQDVARAYIDAIDEHNSEITLNYSDDPENEAVFKMVQSIEDDDTGFKGAIYMDEETGHSIVFLGGLDKIGPDSDLGDLKTVGQAAAGKINDQTGPAQQLYLDAVSSSTSVEVVGYSLGSMLANDLAARLDAKSTNIADIGLPEIKGADGASLYTEAHIKNIQENVTSLQMEGDPYLGLAGEVHGKVIELLASITDGSPSHYTKNYDAALQKMNADPQLAQESPDQNSVARVNANVALTS